MIEQKNILLPHKFQIVGWWFIAAAIVIAIALILGDIDNLIDIPVMLAWIPCYVGILLVCLSREKIDDEYISSVRSRIVSILAVIVVIESILYTIVMVCAQSGGRLDMVSKISWISPFFSPVILAVVYIVSLKMTLLIQKQKTQRYAE